MNPARTFLRSGMAAALLLLAGTVALVAPARPAAAAVMCGGSVATHVGTAGDDTIFGTPGRDVIAGLAGNDRLYGLEGDDAFCGDAGDDRISAGVGEDEVIFTSSEQPVSVNLQGGFARGEGTDVLLFVENVTGSPFDDRIDGNDAANRLAGYRGDDLVLGVAGNDILADGGLVGETNQLSGGPGDDVLYGGPGDDAADFYDYTGNMPTGVSVDLTAGTATGHGSDLLSGIDSVYGSNAADTIVGNAFANTLHGRSGQDTISGRAGDDTLHGGTDNDTLDGEAGQDRASFYGADPPVVASLTTNTATGEGTDTMARIEGLVGGDGNDRLTGNIFANTLEGGPGNDTLDGQAGSDFAAFDGAETSIQADLAAGSASGAGNDTLVRIENLRGGPSEDDLRGNDGPNTLVAGAYDRLEGRGGNDVFDSIAPRETFSLATISYASAPGRVTVDVAGGTATGAAGTDQIRFQAAYITGSNFSDQLICGTVGPLCSVDARKGDDTITGGPKGDYITPGLGNDRIDARGASDDVVDFNGNLAVSVNLPAGTATGQGNDTLVGVERVRGGSANDTITGLGGPTCEIHGSYGNDVLRSVGSGCTLLGEDGNDTLTGTAGRDFLYPGNGNDTVTAGAGNDHIRGDEGNDRIDGGADTDILSFAYATENPLSADLAAGVVTGLGTDTVTGIEEFSGSTGNDTIRGTDGPNTIYGHIGNDTMLGGGGDDRIYGFEGNDWMDGGLGNDVLSGYLGDDMTHGGEGYDTLTFEGTTTAVSVDLAGGSAGGQGNDRIATIENLIGSGGNDYLRGNDQPNVIDGAGGTDDCVAVGASDLLVNCP